jgi:NitT/TauT family transport system substrate-binding protein
VRVTSTSDEHDHETERLMHNEGDNRWTRRQFLGTTGLTAAGAFFGLQSEPFAAEPPPETTKLRLSARQSPVPTCHAAWYLAEEFLRAEGFTDVQYIRGGTTGEAYKALASGEVDLGMGFSAPLLINLDAGDAIVFLGGGHVGCFELFGTDRVRAIRDLKGKTVAVPGLGSTPHVFLAIMAAYVGLDPRKDINWVSYPPAESIRLLGERKIDAFMAFPPEPQELRAKKIGHVVVNSMMDRPWSQYFCCLSIGNREFVRKNPVATKRWFRAVMKAAVVCAREPERVARFLVDKGYTKNYHYALQTVKEIDYGKWREYDAEDTLRFYGLRLHEVGMIKTNPQKIIAQGTDWRFLRELKKELKG